MADRLVGEAPDLAWLRAFIEEMERRLGTVPLERFLACWDLSASEAARAFGVSRQALSKWRKDGVPPERAPALADLDTATETLCRYVKRERIRVVVRRPAAALGGRSLLEIASEGRHEDVARAVAEMFDLRRVQP
jgi:transposase-like protein